MIDAETVCHYSGLPSLAAYEKAVSIAIAEDSITRDEAIDRIIQMAWEDRTPFEAIEFQFGLREADVKKLMKEHLRPSSYRLWRERVQHSNTKHAAKRNNQISRFKSKLQRNISNNKISKRP